ncbi:hypothetical protein [Chryseobacterium lathyri]|uniref:Uncharacterized protein n=1 Tax=Chryseobacterium lathyri TaxID=395933 RepID=A0ABT9SHI0_9FLAO|nr:hypothetical protein [Chryseobacterium lathyri]MDP9958878.1 hypothetical protein [Chryseobacterium lathyri]MDQ0066914.1 hypothetical protein [Chryseobacterium lathyri]
MSRFLLQKKKLLEEVLEKASSETTEQSSTGILKSLERSLLDDFKISLSYKSLETYYKVIVENENDYNIKPVILDDLSRYLGYESFKAYCLDWKTIEYAINQTVSKIVINIVNKPFINLTEFISNNKSMSGGVLGIIALMGLLFSKGVFTPKECMYWDGDQYQLAHCNDKNPNHHLIPIDTVKLKYLKKSTRPDTINVESSLGKVWYDKSDNDVEFFTSHGVNPENEKTLKEATEHIIYTYGGENAK